MAVAKVMKKDTDKVRAAGGGGAVPLQAGAAAGGRLGARAGADHPHRLPIP